MQQSFNNIFRHPRIFPLLVWQFLNSWAPWVGIMMIYLNRYLQLSFSQIMLLQSIFMFSNAILEIPTGILGDKFGRKLSVLISEILFAIGFSFYLFKAPLIFYALGELLMGMGRAFGSGSDEALQYDTFKELKLEKFYTKFISFQRSIVLSASLLSGIFGTWALSSGLSMRFLWVTTPILLLISIVILIFFIKEPKVKLEKELVPDYKAYLKSAFKTLKESKPLRAMVIIGFLLGIMRYTLNWSIQPLFLYFGVPLKYFTAIILTATSLTAILLHQIILKKKIKLNFYTITNILLAINLGFVLVLLFLKLTPGLKLLLIIAFIIQRVTNQELMQIARSFWQPFIKSFNRATVLSGISLLNTMLFATINLFWGRLLDISVYWSVVITFFMLSTITWIYNFKNRKSLIEKK